VKIAVLHPGAMGVTVAASLTESGHEVRWLSAGRSEATADRARAASLASADSMQALLADADGVISVCPPHAARTVAEDVQNAGFRGIYVDANAVAPATARWIETLVGENFVDGGIVGPPALRPGTTRLYLSGPRAAEVAGWFSAGPLAAHCIEGPPGAASALKMCYAAYTKGTSALLLAIRALAEAEGVTAGLLEEWSVSQPDLARRSEGAARGTAPKAWRFVGEMEEIAATFSERGLPGGFHQAAAEVYRRMSDLKEAQDPDLDRVLAALSGKSGRDDPGGSEES
jgi:3-hydroxyisobutyrate dehydrogenase-like beta-hydroxyacid dehydrogenase